MDSRNDRREMVTLAEAARELGVGRATLKRAIDRGDLRAFRLGDTTRSPIRVRRKDLDAYVERRAVKAAAAGMRVA